jgi:hypothetical protein
MAGEKAGNGGGGGGGGAGFVIVQYESLTGSGTITAPGGAKGVKGNDGIGLAGEDGTDGAAGIVLKIDTLLGTITVS